MANGLPGWEAGWLAGMMHLYIHTNRRGSVQESYTSTRSGTPALDDEEEEEEAFRAYARRALLTIASTNAP